MTEGDPPKAAEPGGDPLDPGAVDHLLGQLRDVLSRSQRSAAEQVGSKLLPAWQQVTEGEPRWQVSLGVLAAVALQVTLPAEVSLRHRWLLPAVAVLLLLALVIANPRRINQRSKTLRLGSLLMIATISGANALSATRLVNHLLNGTNTGDASRLLLTGGAIWLTNVIAFGLWYWELDRGGPIARAHADNTHPDFLFPQMTNPEVAPPDWEPGFVDYLYISFTNAAAFSPTDVLPLSRWTKLTMLLQSVVSLSTVALVVARAVNTLQ